MGSLSVQASLGRSATGPLCKETKALGRNGFVSPSYPLEQGSKIGGVRQRSVQLSVYSAGGREGRGGGGRAVPGSEAALPPCARSVCVRQLKREVGEMEGRGVGGQSRIDLSPCGGRTSP